MSYNPNDFTVNVNSIDGTYLSGPVDWGNITITDTFRQQNTIQLNGEGADIVVNGRGIVSILDDIQERLALLKPNPALEAEWEQLRELGRQYRELEAQLLEKQKMWSQLKGND